MAWVDQKKGMPNMENSEWATPVRKEKHITPCKSD